MPTRCPFPHHLFTRKSDEPQSPARRALFKGAALAGGAAMLGGLAPHAYAAAPATTAPAAMDESHAAIPFYGPHQAGVTDPAPAAAMAVSFNVLATNRTELSQLFQILTERFAFLTQGGAVETADPAFPPPDSGLLGPVIAPNRLTATLAVGPSLFDGRFGLAPIKPVQLRTMTAFPNDRLDGDWCHGDILIQFCAQSAETNLHALRDIIKHTPSLLMVRWKQDGFLPESATRSAGKATPRNMLGFKDGTGNPSDTALIDRLVWVGPDAAEPAWTAGGTYQVVRIIRNLVEQWDRTPLIEQENIIGRNKITGAPLDGTAEHDVPDFAADPKGKKTPLDAHIRLANPRTDATEDNLILRRGFNYSRGANRAGQLDMGLLFHCYQADLEKGFLTVQGRLNGEPLEEYIKPTGGGFFFVLPGVPAAGRYLGQSLLEAAAAA
ncbi:MAG: iron uptake transporter deferrochelatase/peroxidase subunit [Devosia sp.]|nr:iron uptake transporter deferrochelatase/peroxidase subunit [Devosia sp.]